MTSENGYAEVIGDPIAHSRSPQIHRFWLEKAGLDLDYRASRVTRQELPSFIAERRQDRAWRGCNVTMPLKLDAIMLADEASDRAVAAGAANLLIPKDGMLLAGNTDVEGVLQLLGPQVQRSVAGGITLLGNGGAARAVLVALKMLNFHAVRLQARDVSAAYKLAVEFGLETEPAPFDWPIVTEGLVNATPLGMSGVDPFEIDISRMPASGFVFDMVTEPIETPLLKSARARGLEVRDGIEMLVEQAAASFVLLFGSQAPRSFDGELMKALRS
jgi:shikimate dehydrogenase